ncbi:YngK protein [Pseudomonas amygdali pv. ciccaronei]|nr:YngK protein [Pseudomonas amygdali pv. ciccaronei]
MQTRGSGCLMASLMIAPQVYWPFARKVARYDVITRWWADTVRGTSTALYIGMALYKVGTPSAAEPDWTAEGGVPENHPTA